VVFFTVLAAGLVPVPVRWIRARLPAGPGAARWSRDVLPVDPLRADRFLALLGESPGLCEPSEALHSATAGLVDSLIRDDRTQGAELAGGQSTSK